MEIEFEYYDHAVQLVNHYDTAIPSVMLFMLLLIPQI